jgi:exodeoxyribonuclease VII large subunit
MFDILVDQQVLTISDLNRSVKNLLESHFGIVWVEGEVSNLAKPQSGHIYFTLKDQFAQIRCAMFKGRTLILPFELENGMHILAKAKISLYEGRGDYQLIIEQIEDRGEGLLRRRFEMLKKKLAEEGLFDYSQKKKLSPFPKQIGVITSPTGAAIRDVLSVLKRRFATIPVLIYPTSVQGEKASSQIAAAIKLANLREECDVLLVCRGGGSLEDLFAFNEEIVARAIFESKIPIVAGIGHEIDFTIADFVADQRAATPSAAAELLSPNKKEFARCIIDFYNRIVQGCLSELRHNKMLLANHQSKLLHPSHLLQQHSQTIDMNHQALIKIMELKLHQEKRKVQLLTVKLNHLSPLQTLKENRIQLQLKTKLLNHLIVKKLHQVKQDFGSMARTLNTVSPLNTLDRGYSITTKNSHVVDDIQQVDLGDKLKIILKNGLLDCLIQEKTFKK